MSFANQTEKATSQMKSKLILIMSVLLTVLNMECGILCTAYSLFKSTWIRVKRNKQHGNAMLSAVSYSLSRVFRKTYKFFMYEFLLNMLISINFNFHLDN